MPIFEYVCTKCGYRFEELVRPNQDQEPTKCPIRVSMENRAVRITANIAVPELNGANCGGVIECGGKLERCVSVSSFTMDPWMGT